MDADDREDPEAGDEDMEAEVAQLLRDFEEEGDTTDEEDDVDVVVGPGDGYDRSSSSSSDDDDIERESFDPDLPTRHTYLGPAREVAGRTILEEDLVQELVTFAHPGITLMPGQTVPLTIFHPSHVSAVRRLIDTVKTFGSLHVRAPSGVGQTYEEASVGTTAEIFEYRDPPEDSNEVGLKIKVRGRQRFRVLSSGRQMDGTRVATVEILREVKLPDPFHPVRLRSRDRLRFVRADAAAPEEAAAVAAEEEEGPAAAVAAESSENGRKRKSSFRDAFGDLMASLLRKRRPSSPPPTNRDDLKPELAPHRASRANHFRTAVYAAPLAAFPNWVYEMYDPRILVEEVHGLLASLRLFSHAKVSIPSDPEGLSFWVACNLPVTDAHRGRILEMNCAVQRLRYELSLLRKFLVLCCRRCKEEIATRDDIFSMSQEGPQSAYVNPHGHVHETLTLYNVRSVYPEGSPSTAYSWFPGYAWTIVNCRGCNSHMGWKFTAASDRRRLHPKKFWGISRQNVTPLLRAGAASDEDGGGGRVVAAWEEEGEADVVVQ